MLGSNFHIRGRIYLFCEVVNCHKHIFMSAGPIWGNFSNYVNAQRKKVHRKVNFESKGEDSCCELAYTQHLWHLLTYAQEYPSIVDHSDRVCIPYHELPLWSHEPHPWLHRVSLCPCLFSCMVSLYPRSIMRPTTLKLTKHVEKIPGGGSSFLVRYCKCHSTRKRGQHCTLRWCSSALAYSSFPLLSALNGDPQGC